MADSLDPEVYTGDYILVTYYHRRVAVTQRRGRKVRVFGPNTKDYPYDEIGKPRINVYGPYADRNEAVKEKRRIDKEMKERLMYEPHSIAFTRVRPLIRWDLGLDTRDE